MNNLLKILLCVGTMTAGVVYLQKKIAEAKSKMLDEDELWEKFKNDLNSDEDEYDWPENIPIYEPKESSHKEAKVAGSESHIDEEKKENSNCKMNDIVGQDEKEANQQHTDYQADKGKKSKDNQKKPSAKRVYQLNAITGDVENVYSSASMAEKMTGISRTSISKAANGSRKTAGGYAWRFEVGEQNNET